MSPGQLRHEVYMATVWGLPEGGERDNQDAILAKKLYEFTDHSFGITVMLKGIVRDNDVKFLRVNFVKASVGVTKLNDVGQVLLVSAEFKISVFKPFWDYVDTDNSSCPAKRSMDAVGPQARANF